MDLGSQTPDWGSGFLASTVTLGAPPGIRSEAHERRANRVLLCAAPSCWPREREGGGGEEKTGLRVLIAVGVWNGRMCYASDHSIPRWRTRDHQNRERRQGGRTAHVHAAHLSEPTSLGLNSRPWPATEGNPVAAQSVGASVSISAPVSVFRTLRQDLV